MLQHFQIDRIAPHQLKLKTPVDFADIVEAPGNAQILFDRDRQTEPLGDLSGTFAYAFEMAAQGRAATRQRAGFIAAVDGVRIDSRLLRSRMAFGQDVVATVRILMSNRSYREIRTEPFDDLSYPIRPRWLGSPAL